MPRGNVRLTVSRKDYRTLENIADAVGFKFTKDGKGASQILSFILAMYGKSILDNLENTRVMFVEEDHPEEQGSGANKMGFK
ncbi:hypothetical protein CLI64_11120 [Nostoc sp. CENA543]|uniref:hypothetical protein n=1 Tax=Nostoc sp. CENA543 TaxID=1869241 RepID=UPI000CA11F28|nr:hypothetical protein [Nostoc sp. CENA543]AUT00905.1 hypothetical protein CLI64_11120 [Nostoc sp. CENA543]